MASFKSGAPKSSHNLCEACREQINDVVMNYSQPWKKNEENHHAFISNLSRWCEGFDNAIMTQANTHVGMNFQSKREKLQITPIIFKSLIEKSPFSKKLDTCAVVGSSGLLLDSGCGKMIDAAQFVIRCNLPRLNDEYRIHVGSKMDLVSGILTERYGDLSGQRHDLVDRLESYGKFLLLLLPTFSSSNTRLANWVVASINHIESPARPIFLNPDYLRKLHQFWRSNGMKTQRLSMAMTLASLALELCSNVHLYGFWPISNHPYKPDNDMKAKTNSHNMPTEFDMLLKLHSQGVLKLHQGNCQSDEK
ncbi:alpha-2,8-sialyltransferase 8F-like isoform X2 [Dunckerocampus dactyliophorus]|nr:alpha-2,8-sialyltransferase 8F-like isoform X2 [Dunckerocampus dactyliophorus]XP_054620017.1 alpha-2,8-sialyltransferase 8F-like isoform X2 [Dunckerocampus dactyliophorus]XP_054620018.1 alpha-2,8-sialyltransferase 8F-like isoform X2 [Dunckerocampus dactyliophorus]